MLAVWLNFSTPTGKTTDNSVVKFFLPFHRGCKESSFGRNVDGNFKRFDICAVLTILRFIPSCLRCTLQLDCCARR